MVSEVLEMILSQEKGNSTLMALQNAPLAAGQVFVECYYSLSLGGRQNRDLARIVPPQTIRFLFSEKGAQMADKISAEQLQSWLQSVPRQTGLAILKARINVIKQLLKLAEFNIEKQRPVLIEQWVEQVEQALSADIDRLTQLAAHNKLIRNEEIDFAQERLETAISQIKVLQPQLDSLRILVTM